MKNATRTVTALAAGAAALFTLTACSGGGPGGTYYYDGDSAPIGRLVIDGENVTFETFRCIGGSESHNESKGVLSEEGNSVSWTEEGRYEGSDPLVANSDGDVVTLGKTTFSKEGSDAAQELIDDFEKLCTKRDSNWKNPL
ncbi:hypothetical protein [Actinomadura algeriensis]|uniref:Lipoprotein n=1 Tax=Actinomadura algeriensis TaxID=1679523 RepID=A0ABR9JMB2_9ACTN|nr:hypothetical protein [Actinomadura algeriensis]MBE1531643.1 hypothetical protein [Actinomadura algeriensis]